jgi:hypothetical protein
MFRLDPHADTAGTCRVNAIEIPPAVLVGLFGPPGPASLEGKVSGDYRFTSDAGDVFTLYDYKQTTLYHGDDDERWPTPAAFWAGTEPVEFSIGGRGHGPADFRGWLVERWRGQVSGEAT